MNANTQDPVVFLKEVFDSKSKANPRFSLRGFASQLGLSPGGLHQILNRKKKLSYDRAYEITKRLKLPKKEADYFLTLVEMGSTGSVERKSELIERLSSLNKIPIHNLNVDQFKLISSWYGLAILQLVTDCDPALSNSEIAKRLGITMAEVDSTLERLERLELIERTDKNPEGFRFRRVKESSLFQTAELDEALKKYYIELFKKTEEALQSQSSSERVGGAQTFAFDVSQIEDVRKLTDEYLNALNNLAAKGENKAEVYQAIAHVFRLTENNRSKTKVLKKLRSKKT